MEQEKKSKPLIFLILAIIIIIAVVVVILYFCKGKDNVDDKQTLYHIESGEKATIIDSDLDYNETRGRIEISFDYPQFDIDSPEIEEVNNEIKNDYKVTYDNDFVYPIDEDADFPVEIRKNGRYYCSNDTGICEFEYITYNISDTDKYIAVSFKKTTHCHCSGGSRYYGYAIDKKTKKLLTNSELVKLFGKNEQEILNEFNDNIDAIACLGDNYKARDIEDITIYIENNELFFVNESCN